MQHRVERWRRLNFLIGEFKRRAPAPTASVRARLRYMEDVYDYISSRVDDALDSWQSRRAPKVRRGAKPGKPAKAPRPVKRGRAA